MTRASYRFPIAVAITVALFNSTALTPLLPLYMAGGISELAITVAFAVYGIVVLLMLLFGLSLFDRVGRRSALLVGLAVSAVATLVTLVTNDARELILSRVLTGVSASIFVGIANAFLLARTPAGKSAGALPAIAVASGLGAGPIVAGILSDVLPGPRTTTWIFNLAIIGLSAAMLFLVDNPIPAANDRVTSPAIERSRRGTFGKVGAVGFGGFLAFGIYSAAAPALLHSAFSLNTRWVVGLIVGAFFLASAAGPLVGRMLRPEKAVDVGAVAIVLGLVGVGAGILTGIGQGIAMDAGLGLLTHGLSPSQNASITLAYFVVLYVAVSVPVVVIGVLSLAVPLAMLTTICCLGAGIAIGIVSAVTSLRLRRSGSCAEAGVSVS